MATEYMDSQDFTKPLEIYKPNDKELSKGIALGLDLRKFRVVKDDSGKLQFKKGTLFMTFMRQLAKDLYDAKDTTGKNKLITKLNAVELAKLVNAIDSRAQLAKQAEANRNLTGDDLKNAPKAYTELFHSFDERTTTIRLSFSMYRNMVYGTLAATAKEKNGDVNKFSISIDPTEITLIRILLVSAISGILGW